MSDPNQVKLTLRARLLLRKAIQRYKSRYECFKTETKYGLISEKWFREDLENTISSFYWQMHWQDRPDYDWFRQHVIEGHLKNSSLITDDEAHEMRSLDPNFRKGQKYVKNEDHEKKHRAEDPWRIEECYRFDKRGKSRCGFCCQPKSKKPYCKADARKHRAWQKQMMYHEKYDMLVGDTHTVNKWAWS